MLNRPGAGQPAPDDCPTHFLARDEVVAVADATGEVVEPASAAGRVCDHWHTLSPLARANLRVTLSSDPIGVVIPNICAEAHPDARNLLCEREPHPDDRWHHAQNIWWSNP